MISGYNKLLLSDEAGELVARTEYYPYGQIRYESGEPEDYGFTGKEQDRSTGLIYFVLS